MLQHVALRMAFLHARYFGRPSCPKCGELMMAPEHSECRSEGIRHFWRCEGCDYGFESVIAFCAAGEAGHLSR